MTRCFEPREIAAALALPAADPGRHHLDTCPRCRNLAVAYTEFIDESPAGEMDLAGADAELQRRLARTFTTQSRERRPWWHLDLPRPIWASAAAVLAVSALVLLGNDLKRPSGGNLPPGPGVLRGADSGSGLLVKGAGGTLLVSWSAGAADDQAVVVFYDTQMRELGRTTTSGTSLTVAAEDPLAAAVYCQLLHLNVGDIIARSAIVPVRPARE